MSEAGYALWHGGTCGTFFTCWHASPDYLKHGMPSCIRVKDSSSGKRDEEWVVPSNEKGSNNLCSRLFVPDERGTICGECQHVFCGFMVGA